MFLALRETIRSILLRAIGKQNTGFGFVVRTRFLLAIDALSVLVSYGLSLFIDHESIGRALSQMFSNWYWIVGCLVVRITFNRLFGLYARLWRYASVQEVMQIVKASSLSSLLLTIINLTGMPHFFHNFRASYSFLVLDWLINLAFLCGTRLALRIGLKWLLTHNKRVLGQLGVKNNVLIVGAGDAGSIVVRMLFDNPELRLMPAGFIDDDPLKQTKYVYDVPVLGTRKDIPRVAKEKRANEVIVAMPTAPQAAKDEVCQICAKAGVQVRVIPDLRDILAGRLTIEQLRQWRSTDGEIASSIHKNGKSPTFQNILVTGGAGFIGSNFVRYMLNKHTDYRIVVFDKLTYAGNPDNLLDLKQTYGEKYVFVRGDICNFDQISGVMRAYEIDCIVNFAAETHVDRSLIDPKLFLETNVIGTYQLLEAARQFEVLRYHQVSTDETYGQVVRGFFSEEDPLETRSPYSASKASADLLVHAYYTSFGIPATITRGSNNIGPYQYPEKAVPLFITNALDNQPLPVYGDGLYVRDYQYVIDHCHGIDIVLHRGADGEIYNLGGGSELTAMELAKKILDYLGRPHSLIYLVRDRDGQDRRYSLNCSKIKSLGWKPEYTFDQALEATIEWYCNNEWWWRNLKSAEYQEFYKKQYQERLENAVQAELGS